MTSNIYKIQNSTINYDVIKDEIHAAGYTIPSIDDGDVRQRWIWDLLTKKNIELSMRTINRDTIDKFEKTISINGEDKKLFQSRIGSENPQKVNEYIKDFFEDNIQLRRLPFAMNIHNKWYVSVGNHRIKAFRQGYDIHPRSNVSSHFILIDPNDKLSEYEKININKMIADFSNSETGNETQSESAESIAKQIKDEIVFQESYNSSFFKNQNKKDYIEEWLRKMKPNTTQHTLSKAKNKIFDEDVSKSLDTEDVSSLNREWKIRFPRGTWDPDSSKNQYLGVTHWDNFKNGILNRWLLRDEFTRVQERIEMCIRAGQTKKSIITRTSEIDSQRSEFLGSIEEWNKNPNVVNSGMPFIQRIMFVKQSEGSDYCAYEWCSDSNSFFPVTQSKE